MSSVAGDITVAPPIAAPVHRTKAEMAHLYLREQILSGALEPGQKLTLASLARMLNISQMPVRDALLRLEREGLVRINPHTDIHVVKLEKRDTVELFQIRAVLEGLAARLACQNATRERVAELRAVNARFVQAFETQQYGSMAEANWAFHRVIVQTADNRNLSRQIEEVWARGFRFRIGYKLVPGHAQATIREHDAIADAMERRDAMGCERTVIKHIERGGRELLNLLDDVSD